MVGPRTLLATFGSLLLSGPSAAQPASQVEFFESKIRPVLADQCYRCHSAEAEKEGKLKGGLRLDDREAMRRGGDNGPAVVPGEPKKGTLLKALR